MRGYLRFVSFIVCIAALLLSACSLGLEPAPTAPPATLEQPAVADVDTTMTPEIAASSPTPVQEAADSPTLVPEGATPTLAYALS